MKKEVKNQVNNSTATEVKKFDLTNFKSSVLNTSFKKENDVYRPELFQGMQDKQKKAYRGKIRKMLISYMNAFVANADNKEKVNAIKKEFTEFYAGVYKINDYTVNSVCSANLQDDKKALIAKGLEIAK